MTQFFVQTRWALALWTEEPPDDRWVEQRRRLLLDVTAPSLLMQADLEFVWLIYVASRYADREREILQSRLGGDLEFEVVSVEGPLTQTAVEQPLLARCRPGTWVATARLDSDDAYGPEFVKNAKAELAAYAPPVSIDFPEGVMVDAKRGIPLRRPYPHSAFQVMLSEVGDSGLTTGLHFDHTRIAKHVPYVPLASTSPQWFVAIHEVNTSSRAFGVPQPASIVPEYLRSGLQVKETSAIQRWAYFAERSLAYARSLVSEGDFRARIRRARLAIPSRRSVDRTPEK